MWPWQHARREPIGEPPPELEVVPAEVVQGGEVQIGIQGPPGGVFEVEFDLEPPAPAPPGMVPPVGPPGPPGPGAPPPAPAPTPKIVPLPGNPPGPASVPPVVPPTVSSSSASTGQLPGLADQIATVIAYAIVFYGMVAAAQAANIKFGWLVTLAMLAIVWFLRDVIVTPLQGLVRAVVLVVFHVLFELVEFVWKWLQGVGQLFGGDLVKAILQMLMVAAFLWVWELASQIPVIGQLFTWIEETASSILTWVQTQVQVLSTFFDGIRRSLEGAIGDLTKGLGDLGDQLRTLLDQQIDSLFGRIQTSIRGLRAEVLGRLDFVRLAVNLQTGIFAAALHLSPETARQYLTRYARHHPHDAVAHAAGVWASTAHGVIGAGDVTGTPWDVHDELLADLNGLRVGVRHDADDRMLAIIDDLRTLQQGKTPAVDPLDPALLEKGGYDLPGPGDVPPPDLPAIAAPEIPPVEAVG